jgi:hypothetical protein
LHGGFVATADGPYEIQLEQPSDTFCIRLRDGTLLFAKPPGFLARDAVCNAITNDDVAAAEHLRTDDANAETIERSKTLPAVRTGKRSITLPHD